MADTTEAGSDAQITFKVKTSADGLHTITMAETATVLDLKTKLSTRDFENVPVERQRLIYSGRVMKNDDTLATYKIKPNNTIHMVKSAASNNIPEPAASAPGSAPNIPSNMASGTANNPLAGLTGARYAGHQINLPDMEMFGPDGGMGPPMDEERLQRLMADPNIQQSMNEALNNPNFVNMLIDSNPMLRNMPNAREIITSPFMRQMMTNPQMMSQAMRMQRNMQGGDAGFPAPGATDTTPEGAATSENNRNATNTNTDASQPNLFGSPYVNPFMTPGVGMNPSQMLQQLSAMGLNPFPVPGTTPGQNPSSTPGATQTPGSTQGSTQGSTPNHAPANPFAALFPPANPQGGAQEATFGMNPGDFQRFAQMFGAGISAPPPPPADTRPPEERYAEQLRQLNDMGFCDFDRNVAALRRSGGSVQGAVEHLLSNI